VREGGGRVRTRHRVEWRRQSATYDTVLWVVGGAHHCRSHALASGEVSQCDVMYRVQYAAYGVVFAYTKLAILRELSLSSQVMGFSAKPITALLFILYIKSRNFTR